ncbi:MAG: DUF2971 domain-containing protein [Methylobacter sp.]|nr:MAG: DUF2971 domain-containing protein [Methylobacter sp.]
MSEEKRRFLDLIGNNDYGVLRAQWSASYTYLKKYPDVLWYRGDQIFHYTDLLGLIGILSNRGFWLSDARYLNDAEELHNGANLTVELIQRLLVKKCYASFKEVLEGTLEKLNKTSFDHHYICSFSMVADTLEHWRAYAMNGSGICIGFDLKNKTEYPHFRLGPNYFTQKVIYEDNIKIWILLSVIHRYRHEFTQDLKDHSIDFRDDYINSMASSLSSVFVNFKNKAFHTEQEVRLVDSSSKIDFYNKKYHRVSNGMIVPYVCTYDTKLKKTSGEELNPDNLPISKIIVGPIASQESTINSIKDFISDLGFDSEIEVVKSNIPYRG